MWGEKSNMPKIEKPIGEEDAVAANIADDKKPVSRRSFFKKAAVGAVALTGTAELAKQVATTITDDAVRLRYEKEVLAGDAVMSEWEYVVMSDREKQDMVQTFIDNYKNKG